MFMKFVGFNIIIGVLLIAIIFSVKHKTESKIADQCDANKDPVINGVTYRCARVGESKEGIE